MNFYYDSFFFDDMKGIENRFIKKLDSSFLDTKKLKIWLEFSNSPSSPQFRPSILTTYNCSGISHQPFPIEDYLATYDFHEDLIIIYIKEVFILSSYLSTPSNTISFQHILHQIVYYAVGKWACHKYKLSNRRHNTEKFYLSGEQYQNYVAQMLAYHCMKKTEQKDFVRFCKEQLDKDYQLFVNFVEQDKLKTTDLHAILKLMRKVRKMSERISAGMISEIMHSYISNGIW